METLTRLVAESLARHGFDRPVDYRRLQWSHWFRCESHHSLLVVPSKPGVFALAEEVMDLGYPRTERVATLQTQAQGHVQDNAQENVEERRFSAASDTQKKAALAAEGQTARHTVEERRFSAAPGMQNNAALAAVSAQPASTPRMLAVAHFFEDDDMAFVLDRMLSHENPMRTRLVSGRYFVRYVVIEDPSQRRNVCNALNQWILSSAEKATGIESHFATSLEPAPRAEQTHVASAASAVSRARSEAQRSGTGNEVRNPKQCDEVTPTTAPRINSAVATTIHCSSSFPSGF